MCISHIVNLENSRTFIFLFFQRRARYYDDMKMTGGTFDFPVSKEMYKKK